MGGGFWLESGSINPANYGCCCSSTCVLGFCTGNFNSSWG